MILIKEFQDFISGQVEGQSCHILRWGRLGEAGKRGRILGIQL